MASHVDYYEDATDAQAHNSAPAFPQQSTGDSWGGALCQRHKRRATTLFAGCYAVLCMNSQCPSQCCICAGEFAPREGAA